MKENRGGALDILRDLFLTMKDDANDRMQKLNKFGKQITGYKILRANSFLDNGKVVYSSF